MNNKPKLTFNVDHSSNEIMWLQYLLAVLNIFLPWTIVSWIGIPLSLYAKDRLLILEWKNVTFNVNHKLYTNIALGVFIFFLSMSILRFILIFISYFF